MITGPSRDVVGYKKRRLTKNIVTKILSAIEATKGEVKMASIPSI
jgi:hypothetical protein